MKQYNLRKGDLLVAGQNTGIVLKQTKAYWYYFYDGMVCRIRKERLWHLIDSNGRVEVRYGSTMKRRKKQPRHRSLDLHGTLHADVDEKIRKYLNWIEYPTRIITGHSDYMKSAVKRVAEEYGLYCRENIQNPGELIIEETSIQA